MGSNIMLRKFYRITSPNGLRFPRAFAAIPREQRRHSHATLFNWEDPLLLREQLTEEELEISRTAHDYWFEEIFLLLRRLKPTNLLQSQEQLLPRVTGMFGLLEGVPTCS